MTQHERVSSGLTCLDEVLDGLRMGDNVVWRVDGIDEYRKFASLFAAHAVGEGRRLVYIRFASHPPLLQPGVASVVYDLDACQGFEAFSSRMHAIITQEGQSAFYVFDCLSSLLDAWATDAMIGNFFRVTCPYLFELDTVAYFAVLRPCHSFTTIARIRETTQLMLDLYTCDETLSLHPLKVWERFSPTMFLPHRLEGGRFMPLTSSRDATMLFVRQRENLLRESERHLDSWHRLFLKAERVAEEGGTHEERETMADLLKPLLFGRDQRILGLVRRHFRLEDVMEVKSRLIGTGFIGGKATGMLLARRILLEEGGCWGEVLEPHDSFYIGSDLYGSYIVDNGWWRQLMRLKCGGEGPEAAEELRARILAGRFAEDVREEFRKMLEYYGQYPIIVRSSSILEDGFGNAFAGKYDSYFLVNQGALEERLEEFEQAVRRIFASAISEEALAYRSRRGLMEHDEQMALLVQRVSGSLRGPHFFPDLAGVGVSYNMFVWKPGLDPAAGMARIVIGLGTRAVDRVEGDCARIVSLDEPTLTPHGDGALAWQRCADVINVRDRRFESLELESLAHELGARALKLFSQWEHREGTELAVRRFTLYRLLRDTPLPSLLSSILQSLERAYEYPVDVEFTVCLSPGQEFFINLVQCRPLQTRSIGERTEFPEQLDEERILFRTKGNFMGGNVSREIGRVILVNPLAYSALDLQGKYETARIIGRLNRLGGNEVATLLAGPGRWGTGTPSLGVPVRFAEISNVTALMEVAYPIGGLVPDLSFGSHFFQDMVEANIFFVAMFPDERGCTFNAGALAGAANLLGRLLPDDTAYSDVVLVADMPAGRLKLVSDVVRQEALCFICP